MSDQAAKIQFLARMNKVNCVLQELGDFLMAEKLISKDLISEIHRKNPDMQAQEMYLILAKNTDKFHLVDWEWTILPKEHMKLTIVTHNGVKEFSCDL